VRSGRAQGGRTRRWRGCVKPIFAARSQRGRSTDSTSPGVVSDDISFLDRERLRCGVAVPRCGRAGCVHNAAKLSDANCNPAPPANEFIVIVCPHHGVRINHARYAATARPDRRQRVSSRMRCRGWADGSARPCMDRAGHGRCGNRGRARVAPLRPRRAAHARQPEGEPRCPAGSRAYSRWLQARCSGWPGACCW
jgi:hypothetical protein